MKLHVESVRQEGEKATSKDKAGNFKLFSPLVCPMSLVFILSILKIYLA